MRGEVGFPNRQAGEAIRRRRCLARSMIGTRGHLAASPVMLAGVLGSAAFFRTHSTVGLHAQMHSWKSKCAMRSHAILQGHVCTLIALAPSSSMPQRVESHALVISRYSR